MILEYIYADGDREQIKLQSNVPVSTKWEYIQSSNKLEFIKTFIPKFLSGQKMVLFDSNHKHLVDFYNNNDINQFETIEKVNKNSRILFFTSGSSGFPVGAFKSHANLLEEVKSLQKIVAIQKIEKVVVTVPFIHIYGILAGLLLPFKLKNIHLVVKEDFLPYELLEEASSKNTLVITTPVFIKALAKLPVQNNLSNTLFVSSTAPLSLDDAAAFEDKFTSKLIQLFGSTETGGIAYKLGRNVEWRTLEGVTIQSVADKLSVISPYISNYLLKDKIEELKQPYITEDIIEIHNNSFTLIGRSNKLIKIAGKRISALQIENILEEIPDIQKAFVELIHKKELLRSEQIIITLETKKKIDKQIIKEKLSQNYGIITIPFTLKFIDKIHYSAMNKKVLFN